MGQASSAYARRTKTRGQNVKLIARFGVIALGSVVVFAVAPAAPRSSPSPRQQAEEAVKFRQADMDMQAYSLAPVLPMLQSASVDTAVAFKAASRLAVLMEMLPDVFEADTSKFSIRTSARPQIWTDPLAFRLQVEDMEKAVAIMASAAMSADRPGTLKASRAVVNACRSCHERFAVGLK
jgi:cytochrome c556